MVDVSHFRPNEISVKTTDKNIIVHGTFTVVFLYLSYVVIAYFCKQLVMKSEPINMATFHASKKCESLFFCIFN